MDKALARSLRARGAALRPVLILGKNGITHQSIASLDSYLAKNELAKVKLLPGSGLEVGEAESFLMEATSSEGLSEIGSTFLLYRKKKEKKGR